MTLGWPSCAYERIKRLHLPSLEICPFSLVLGPSLFRCIVELFQCPQEALELQILQLKRYLKKNPATDQRKRKCNMFWFFIFTRNQSSSQNLNQTFWPIALAVYVLSYHCTYLNSQLIPSYAACLIFILLGGACLCSCASSQAEGWELWIVCCSGTSLLDMAVHVL